MLQCAKILYFLTMLLRLEKKKKGKFKVWENCQMARTYLIKVSKWLNGKKEKCKKASYQGS